jgi:ribosome-associated protein
MKLKKTAALEVVKLVCRVLDDKKAEAITVLDVGAQSSITDYLVIATATSEPHLRALRVELEKVLDTAKVRLVGMETAQESGWLVLDTFDVMIHLFLSETRERYGLERLWRDATEISLQKVLETPTRKATTAPRRTTGKGRGVAPKTSPTKRRAKRS